MCGNTVSYTHLDVYKRQVISCATLMLDAWEGGRPAWRLRGMATDSNRQSQGIGGALLDYLIDWAITDPPISQRIRIFWCNARVPALAFYQRLGWIVAVSYTHLDVYKRQPNRSGIFDRCCVAWSASVSSFLVMGKP